MKILLIEDDIVFRQVLEDLLDHMGHQVESVGSLSDAAACLGRTGFSFNLVLSNLCISADRNGVLVSDLLDSMNLDAPLILVTARDGGAWPTYEAGYGRRKLGYLNKPISMDELSTAIGLFCPIEARRAT